MGAGWNSAAFAGNEGGDPEAFEAPILLFRDLAVAGTLLAGFAVQRVARRDLQNYRAGEERDGPPAVGIIIEAGVGCGRSRLRTSRLW